MSQLEVTRRLASTLVRVGGTRTLEERLSDDGEQLAISNTAWSVSADFERRSFAIDIEPSSAALATYVSCCKPSGP